MSDSESYGSVKSAVENSEVESSEDEPLAKRSSEKTPLAKRSERDPLAKRNSTKSKSKSPAKSPKKSKNKKKDKLKEKKSTKEAKVKKAKASTSKTSKSDPAEPEDKSEEEYEVESIVGHREYNGKLMYKIRWKNYQPVDDTWEDYLMLSCPDLLEMYNLKNNVQVRSIHKQKKRKTSTGRGRPKKTTKKRKASVSDDDNASGSDDIPYDEGSEAEYEVEKIVEMRQKKNGTREFLVHWKKWSSAYDSWEPEENLNCQDLIEKFINRVEEAKNSNVKELRTSRKHTERFTLSTHDSGRRLSKRNSQKQRAAYFDAEGDED